MDNDQTPPEYVTRAWTLMTGTPFEEPVMTNDDAMRSEWLRFYWTYRPTFDELTKLVAWAASRKPGASNDAG